MKFPVILAAIATVSFAAPQIEVYEDSSAGHYRLLPGKSLEDADWYYPHALLLYNY